MAGNIGDMLFKLMGREDPRDQLLKVAGGGGGTPTTPPGAVATPDGTGMGGGTQAPPTPQQATAYQSPMELVGLYEKVMERDRANASIDSGAALLAASMAQDENRPGLLRMAGGGGSSSSVTGANSMIDQIMQMNKATSDLQKKNAMKAQLPAIAKRYGLDAATADYLFETGELDAVIKELEKPDRQLVQDQNGRHILVDKRTNTELSSFGTTKPDETEWVTAPGDKEKSLRWKTGPLKGQKVGAGTDTNLTAPKKYDLVDDGQGGKIRVDDETKQPVPNEAPVVVGPGSTDDLKEWNAVNRERLGAGQPALSIEEFLATKEKRAAPKITDASGNQLPDPPKDMQYDLDEKGVPKKDPETGAYKVVPLSGGPADTRKKDALAEKVKVRQADIVVSAVDDAIKQIDEDSLLPKTGIIGNMIKDVYQPGKNLSEKMATIRANSSLDKLSEMRAASTNGASGLGSVTEGEHKLLQGVIASLEQAQDDKQLKAALRLFRKTYQDIIDGEYSPNRVSAAPKPAATNDVSDEDLKKKYGIK